MPRTNTQAELEMLLKFDLDAKIATALGSSNPLKLPDVKTVSFTNLTFASDYNIGDTVGGYVLQANDRFVIAAQTDGATNGLFTPNASGAPTRAIDADVTGDLVTGNNVLVTAGTYAGMTVVLTTTGVITIGTTAQKWAGRTVVREPTVDTIEIGIGAKTNGIQAIAIGQGAGGANGVQGQSVLLGVLAGGSIGASVSNETAIGYRALQNDTGGGNTAVGRDAGRNVGAAQNNLFFGQTAGEGPYGNSSGGDNINIGVGTNIYGSANHSVTLGNSARSNHADALALGYGTATTLAFQAHIGPRHFAATKMAAAPSAIGANEGGLFFTMDGGGNLEHKIIMDGKVMKLADERGVTFQQVFTTATRPAATIGAGAELFDSTLNKSITSDGTNWRDGAGTIV